MRLITWRALKKGQLRGVAVVELPVVGLRIYDVLLLSGPEGLWASLPNKPELDGEGRQRHGVDGRPSYARILEFTSKKLTDGFSRRVVELVRAKHPQDLD